MKTIIAYSGVLISWAALISAKLLAQVTDVPAGWVQAGAATSLVIAMGVALRYQSVKLDAKEAQMMILLKSHAEQIAAIAASHKNEIAELHTAIIEASKTVCRSGDIDT